MERFSALSEFPQVCSRNFLSVGDFDLDVVEPGRSDALIGAIVLEELDFIADSVTQTLVPRDPKGRFAEIEWRGDARR